MTTQHFGENYMVAFGCPAKVYEFLYISFKSTEMLAVFCCCYCCICISTSSMGLLLYSFRTFCFPSSQFLLWGFFKHGEWTLFTSACLFKGGKLIPSWLVSVYLLPSFFFSMSCLTVSSLLSSYCDSYFFCESFYHRNHLDLLLFYLLLLGILSF